MKILRFSAASMSDALQKIQAQLSPDAVILESRRTDDGVEVLAAVDYDLAIAARIGRLDPSVAPTAANLAALATPAAEAAPHEAKIAALKREVAELKALIHEQLAGLVWCQAPGVPPHIARLFKLFSQLGVEEALAKELLAELPSGLDADAMEDHALRLFAERVLVLPADVLGPTGNERRVIALVGPTGVGKTTTMAKLAAAHVRKFGPEAVAMITTAPQHKLVRAQIDKYASLQNLSLHTAGSAAELQELLRTLTAPSLVLIDGTGVNPRDRQLARQPELFCPLAGQIRTYLVLAANGQFESYGQIISRFRSVPLAGVILTKLDETAEFGAVLSALIRHELGVAWVCNGQRVPADLHHMTANELLDRALALSKRWMNAGSNLASPGEQQQLKAGDSTHVPH